MTESDFEIPFERLPERFAESVAHPPARPAVARPAATVVLMRDATVGVEVLLLRRSRATGFVPGAWVFPGGRVDDGDHDEAVAKRIAGLTAAAAARRLGLDSGPEALAYYVAAMREAFEETGILVARDENRVRPSTAADDEGVRTLRTGLLEDRHDIVHVLDALDCRLDGSSIEYLAHWITPVVERRRYDTRFFAARVAEGSTFLVDGREMSDALWLGPVDALDRHRRGALPMVFPTIRTLEQLVSFDSVDDALSALATREVPAIQPELVLTPTGVALRVPADAEERRKP